MASSSYSGRTGQIVVASPSLRGTALSDFVSPEWAAAAVYLPGDQVTVGTAPNDLQASCTLEHTATASGLSVSSGELDGDDKDNWVKVETGQLGEIQNWTLDRTSETEEGTRVLDTADHNVITNRTASGTLEIMLDPTNPLLAAIEPETTFQLSLYPLGIPTTSGAKYYRFRGNAQISNVGDAFSTGRSIATVTWNSVGGSEFKRENLTVA